MKYITFTLLVFLYISASCQSSLSIESIPDSLLKNAREIVLNENTSIEVVHDNLYKYNYSSTTKFLNSNDKRIPFYVHYDKNIKIKKLHVKVLNKSGVEVLDFSKKDFNDHSATSNSTFVGDNRIKYLMVGVTEFPVTTIFEVETENSNTAFIPSFTPVDDFEKSIIQSTYTINWPSDLELYIKENEFVTKYCNKKKLSGQLRYQLSNFAALEKEEFSPPIELFCPEVNFGLNHFVLEGFNANASSWELMGQWYYSNFLKNQALLPQTAIDDIQSLITGITDEKEKVNLIYQYMQQRSRYISIQLGIGGWKPFSAEKTHKLGYGDCKALTNYTKSLLKIAGIESYFTYLYGDNSFDKGIIREYPNLNANHAILCVIPEENDTIWLECTSNNSPYNFISEFIANRDVVLIKEDKAVIVKTPKSNSNQINCVYNIKVNSSSLVDIDVNKEYSGNEFSRRNINELKSDKKVEFLKKEYGKMTQLKVENFNSSIDKEKNSFNERYLIKGGNLLVKSGKVLIVPYIPFSDYKELPKKIKNRKNPIHINSTIQLTDSIVYTLESLKHSIEASNYEVKTKFGNYLMSVQPFKEGLKVYRSFTLFKGLYSSKEYEGFYEFLKKVQLFENKKSILNSI